MSFDLPVWYLQSGNIAETADKKFNPLGQASGVVVAARRIGSKDPPRLLLLTVQHALRSGKDQRSGPYHSAYRAWPPNFGFRDETAFSLNIFEELTPKGTDPFTDPQDLAFLEVPSTASAQSPARLLDGDGIVVGLNGLSVAGFISGDELITNHRSIVEYALAPNWAITSVDPVTGKCILGSGAGLAGPGVSGGGVFHGKELVGLYRGAFVNTGEHLFLSLRTVREWCQSRGFELFDPLATSAQVADINQGIVTLVNELPAKSLKEQLGPDTKLLEDLRSNLSLFNAYKGLHDNLHQIQLRLPELENAVKKLPDLEAAESVDETLNTFDFQSRVCEEAMGALPANPPMLRLEEKEWHTKLLEAVALGRTGLARAESATCRQATRTVRSILRYQMPRINKKLTLCAGTMNLAGLSKLFAKAGALPKLPSDADASLASSQSSTEQLAQRLRSLLELHGLWQDIDLDLWQAEDELAKVADDPAEFVDVWKNIYGKLPQILSAETAAQWTQIVAPLANEVERLRAAQNWPELRDAFSKLQKACRNRFFGVDINLRNLAGEVASIGDSLNSLLSKV